MAYNRERFKAARVEANQKVTKELNSLNRSESSRGDYHTIDEGYNYFRMMPPHPDDGPDAPSLQPKAVYWLECKVEEKDSEGKGKGTYVWSRRPIFDSRIHGGTEMDIVDKYIEFTRRKVYEEIQDKEEARKKLSPLLGWRSKDGKWNQGILISSSYVCYATKGEIKPETLGRLELWDSDKKELEKLNIVEESDEPIQTDLFSDPDEGSQFIIKRIKQDGKWVNVFSKPEFRPRPGGDVAKQYDEFLISQKVPDAVLMKLDEMEPLSKQFRNSYKRSDFERAFEALKRFDEKNGYHTFENDEFLEIVATIDSYYPEDDTTPEGDKDLPFGPTEEGVADVNAMTRDEMKKYIKEKGYPIKVIASMPDELIREMIVAQETEAPEEPEEVRDTDEEEEVPAAEPIRREPVKVKDDLPWEKEEKEKPAEEVEDAAEKRRKMQERLAKLKRK